MKRIIAIIPYNNCAYCDSLRRRVKMFIKHGDGKIMTVLDEEELTEQQKQSVSDLSKKQLTKQSEDDSADTSIEKKSGR